MAGSVGRSWPTQFLYRRPRSGPFRHVIPHVPSRHLVCTGTSLTRWSRRVGPGRAWLRRVKRRRTPHMSKEVAWRVSMILPAPYRRVRARPPVPLTRPGFRRRRSAGRCRRRMRPKTPVASWDRAAGAATRRSQVPSRTPVDTARRAGGRRARTPGTILRRVRRAGHGQPRPQLLPPALMPRGAPASRSRRRRRCPDRSRPTPVGPPWLRHRPPPARPRRPRQPAPSVGPLALRWRWRWRRRAVAARVRGRPASCSAADRGNRCWPRRRSSARSWSPYRSS